MFFNILTVGTETTSDVFTTIPIPDLTNESGEFVSADQAVSNIKNWWEEWDIVSTIYSNIPKAIIFLVLILIGVGISKLVSKIIIKGMKRAGVDSSVYMFIKRIVSFVINFSFILMALNLFINVNSFLAAIAACGVTIALGLQNSVSQFVSGIQILVTRQFKSGDYIMVDGVEGSVAEIKFMNTIIHTIDNKRIIIPNSTMTSNKVINYSAEKTRRVDLIYSISYSDDISKAKQVILDYAHSNEMILKNPDPVVYVKSHEASSIDLIARVWCDTSNYWDVYFAMQENIKIAFDKNEINIPFNQLDVHIIDNNKE